MTLAYYLVAIRSNNLYLRLGQANDRVTLSLKTNIPPEEWSDEENLPNQQNAFRLPLQILANYLEEYEAKLRCQKGHLTPKVVLETLKEHVEGILMAVSDGRQVDLLKIPQELFIQQNKNLNLPSYQEHIKAIASFMGTANFFRPAPLGNQVLFNDSRLPLPGGHWFNTHYALISLQAYQQDIRNLFKKDEEEVDEVLGEFFDAGPLKRVFDTYGYSSVDVINALYRRYNETYGPFASKKRASPEEQFLYRSEWEAIQLLAIMSQTIHIVDVAQRFERNESIGFIAKFLYQKHGENFINQYLEAFNQGGEWIPVESSRGDKPAFFVKKLNS